MSDLHTGNLYVIIPHKISKTSRVHTYLGRIIRVQSGRKGPIPRYPLPYQLRMRVYIKWMRTTGLTGACQAHEMWLAGLETRRNTEIL